MGRGEKVPPLTLLLLFVLEICCGSELADVPEQEPSTYASLRHEMNQSPRVATDAATGKQVNTPPSPLAGGPKGGPNPILTSGNSDAAPTKDSMRKDMRYNPSATQVDGKGNQLQDLGKLPSTMAKPLTEKDVLAKKPAGPKAEDKSQDSRLPLCTDFTDLVLCKDLLRYWRCSVVDDDKLGTSPGEAVCGAISKLSPSQEPQCNEAWSAIRKYFGTEDSAKTRPQPSQRMPKVGPKITGDLSDLRSTGAGDPSKPTVGWNGSGGASVPANLPRSEQVAMGASPSGVGATSPPPSTTSQSSIGNPNFPPTIFSQGTGTSLLSTDSWTSLTARQRLRKSAPASVPLSNGISPAVQAGSQGQDKQAISAPKGSPKGTLPKQLNSSCEFKDDATNTNYHYDLCPEAVMCLKIMKPSFSCDIGFPRPCPCASDADPNNSFC